MTDHPELADLAMIATTGSWPNPPASYVELLERVADNEWADEYIINVVIPRVTGYHVSIYSSLGAAHYRVTTRAPSIAIGHLVSLDHEGLPTDEGHYLAAIPLDRQPKSPTPSDAESHESHEGELATEHLLLALGA